MTDLERYTNMLKDFGVEFTLEKYDDNKNPFVTVEKGYTWFYFVFEFDEKTEKFVRCGAYE